MNERILKAIYWAVGVMALSAFLMIRRGEPVNVVKILIGGLVIGVAEYIISSFENRRK